MPPATDTFARHLESSAFTLYAVSLHLLVRTPGEAWTRKLQPIAVVAAAYAVYDLSALQ